MQSEEVKKIGNCFCLVLFFIELIELKCMHTKVFTKIIKYVEPKVFKLGCR